MAPDYDLSNLPTEYVDLWICIQADTIFGQIMSDQAERLGFPLNLGHSMVSVMAGKPQAIFSNGLRGEGV